MTKQLYDELSNRLWWYIADGRGRRPSDVYIWYDIHTGMNANDKSFKNPISWAWLLM